MIPTPGGATRSWPPSDGLSPSTACRHGGLIVCGETFGASELGLAERELGTTPAGSHFAGRVLGGAAGVCCVRAVELKPLSDA